MKIFVSGSAVIGATLVTSCLLLSALPSVAETPGTTQQQQITNQRAQPEATTTVAANDDKRAIPAAPVKEKPAPAVVTDAVSSPAATAETLTPAVPITNYTATAYSLYGKTASGKRVTKGFIAADPRVLPLGTRVRLDAGNYSGEYLVADTGGAVRGKRIDIWTPTSREAMRFGRRTVKLTVLTYGPKRHVSPRRRVR